MGLFQDYLHKKGYLHKSEVPIAPVMRVANYSNTPYAPTIDILTDILEFNKSKIQNYSFAELSKNTPIVRNIHNKIALYAFKEGFYIQSSFVKRCKACSTEYDSNVDVCDACGGVEFTKPNDLNKKKLDAFVDSCNVNDFPLDQELESVCLDLLRYDEGIILKLFSYTYENGCLNKELKGIQRVVPNYIFSNTSKSGVLGAAYIGMGVAQGFCPFHRDNLQSFDSVIVCPTCGCPLLTADYYAIWTENKNVKTWYNREEIIRIPMFEMSSRYSMVQTLAQKITSLLAIDSLINDIYVQRRFPNRALFFKMSNIDPLIEANEKNRDELKKDKNYVPMFTVGSENINGEFVKAIDMLGTIDELKLIELQDKYEKDIASSYNCKIDPVTREIIVDGQFITKIQKDFNSRVLKNITKGFGILDWEISLRPSDKAEEANELRLKGLKIQNASGMTNLGFDIMDYDEERSEFIFSDKPTRETSGSFSSFSSNSKGLENTFGNLPGQEDMTKEPPKE